MRTAFHTIQATSHIQLAIWFRWQDVPSSPLYFGVLESNGTPKPSYAGYHLFQTYEGRFSDRTIHQNILAYYQALGPAVLGNPYDNGGTAWVHSWGSGYVQDCSGGSNGRLALMSSGSGTFQVNDTRGLWGFYLANDGVNVLGYPPDDEFSFSDGTRQDFELGYLTWDPINGVVPH